MGRGRAQDVIKGVVRRISGDHREQMAEELESLRQEYFDRALEEGYPTLAAAISQYVGDKKLQLDAGGVRLPKDWVEKSIRPGCEEVYAALQEVAGAAQNLTPEGREEFLERVNAIS